MNKALVEVGCKTIETLISYIEDYIDWSDFTSEEQEEAQSEIEFTKHFIAKLSKEFK